MAYSESSKKATLKYMKKLHRIPIDVKEEYYQKIKSVADSKKQSVRAYILQAVDEKIKMDCDN